MTSFLGGWRIHEKEEPPGECTVIFQALEPPAPFFLKENVLKYISVCSGIEAATVAWESLGWQAIAFSEIEPFPCAVLQHHYPNIPNLGDITKIKGEEYRGTVDLIVGGTPCQDFSIAGQRAGLDGARGNLTFEFIRLLTEMRPRWFVWENVPGILSLDSGRAFGRILRCMAESGFGICYRILDARWFGVPQRRRRVFVVGYFGDWRPACAVLFKPQGMSGNPPPSRQTGAELAKDIAASLRGVGGSPRGFNLDAEQGLAVVGTLQASGAGTSRPAGMASEPDFCVVARTLNAHGRRIDGDSETFIPIAFTQNQMGDVLTGEVAAAISTNQNASGRNTAKVNTGMTVRRLTPTECEFLMGLPRNYTRIPWRGKAAEKCPDGPRYKALGNSMAVPVMRWIGRRIQLFETIQVEAKLEAELAAEKKEEQK